MTLPVLVVDAELAVIQYLSNRLTGTPWASVKISNTGGGGEFIRVRRVGGADLTPAHDAPLIDVLVWSVGDLRRMALAMQLWAWLRGAANEVTSLAVLNYRATVLGPRPMPDPADTTKQIVMLTVSMTVGTRSL